MKNEAETKDAKQKGGVAYPLPSSLCVGFLESPTSDMYVTSMAWLGMPD